MKTFQRIKDIGIKVKRHSREWWTLVKHIMKKWLGLEYIKTIGEKWVNDVNQKFSEVPWEAHKHVKLILSLCRIREMEIKQQSDFMSYPLDRQSFSKNDNSGVGKYVEQLKFSTTAGGIINYHNYPRRKIGKIKEDKCCSHLAEYSLVAILHLSHLTLSFYHNYFVTPPTELPFWFKTEISTMASHTYRGEMK